MPCLELFEKQSEDYKKQILGDKNSIRIIVEAAIKQGWEQYLGEDGIFVGMSGFGASGRAEDLYRHFEITAQNIVKLGIVRLKLYNL